MLVFSSFCFFDEEADLIFPKAKREVRILMKGAKFCVLGNHLWEISTGLLATITTTIPSTSLLSLPLSLLHFITICTDTWNLWATRKNLVSCLNEGECGGSICHCSYETSFETQTVHTHIQSCSEGSSNVKQQPIMLPNWNLVIEEFLWHTDIRYC